MASTYTNDLRLELIATGEAAATWGDKTNVNLTNIASAFGYATQDGFSANADSTTTVADGVADPARAMYFKVTSSATLTATRTLTIAPNTISRLMWIENATTGGQSIAISQGTGANVTIPTAKTAVVYLDGAGSGAAVVDAMAGVSSGASDTLAEILAAGNTTGGTDLAVSTGDDITFADSSKAIFGAGSDLQIYHDASHSYIVDAGTGNMYISTNGNGIVMQASLSETMFAALPNGAVTLYHDNAAKLATTSTGIDVTGTVTGGAATFTTADNLDTLSLISTDADASVGPNLRLYRNSGSPADSDALGRIQAVGRNDNSQDVIYSTIETFALDVSDGTEDAVLNFNVMQGGSSVSFFKGNNTEVVVNDDSKDLDFRVESDNNSHALFVQGSDGNVGIGNAIPIAALDVTGTDAVGNLTSLADTVTRAAAIIRGSTHTNGYGLYMGYGNSSTDAQYIQSTLKTGSQSYPLLLNPYGGNVGIGTSSPNYQLTIGDGTDALETVNIIATDAGQSRLFFSDATSNGQGRFTYDHSDNSLQIYTADTEAMRIDASGNLLVGTTSTNFADKGVIITDGQYIGTMDGSHCATYNRLTSDGEMVRFFKDGVSVGSIGNIEDLLYIAVDDTTDCGIRFDGDNQEISPCTATGAHSDGNIDLGDGSARFKDLYRSGSTISTSDRNMKQDERDLTEAETRVAQACKGLLKAFRFIDAVQVDGDGARIHFGIIAQDLQEAFEAEGLDATNYAMFRPSTSTDENGNEQTRLGVCYENLLAFIIAAI